MPTSKFSFCIMNPPYSGSLHLDFLEKGYDMIADDGQMVIIEPATWLIELRQNIAEKKSAQMKKYIDIKKKINGHVSKVIIENYNKEFNVGLYVPFSITYINKAKKYNNIEFVCFGEKRIVPNLYECNLIGNYDLIWQILDKILLYKDKMINHKFNNKIKYDSSTWYATYKGILNRCGCADPRFSDNWFINNIYTPYYHCCLDIRENISNSPIYKLENGRTYDNPAYSSKLADNICDTKEHLENFKYNVYNTKLFAFLAIVLLIQQNPTPNFAPWLVDKCYTDDEIYKLFDFGKDEIQFIEYVIKKFDRYSPWFNRYLKGPSGNISDEEVQKFIDNL